MTDRKYVYTIKDLSQTGIAGGLLNRSCFFWRGPGNTSSLDRRSPRRQEISACIPGSRVRRRIVTFAPQGDSRVELKRKQGLIDEED
jgi:hypothetical protein